MNRELLRDAKEYSNSFEQCYLYYTEHKDGTFTSIQTDADPEELINMLNRDYLRFARSLRSELSTITDWNEQNIIFAKLQIQISGVVFDNEILNADKAIIINSIAKMASDKEVRIFLIDLVRCMSDSLLWFRSNGTYRLRGTLSTLGTQLATIEVVEPQTKYELAARREAENEHEESNVNVVIPDDEIVIADSKAITRDGVWHLFVMLRQKGVIKQMPDTDLSKTINTLTGHSAEKLRQSKLRTNSAKDKLVQLLKGIINEIEG